MVMLGSSCSPCCDRCGGGLPYVAPSATSRWVPSGSWSTGVSWTRDTNQSGDAWFFYGSSATSRAGGGASREERVAWGNPCNWYSVKSSSPSTTFDIPASLTARATTLPPESAVVHIYSPIASMGARTVRNAYVWGTVAQLSITTTHPAYDTTHGLVCHTATLLRTDVYGGALFRALSVNGASIYNSATFDNSKNGGIKTNASPSQSGCNTLPLFDIKECPNGIVYGGAQFINGSSNGSYDLFSLNNGQGFPDDVGQFAIVYGGATFSGVSGNLGTVYDGATFNSGDNVGSITNQNGVKLGYYAQVFGGAVFNEGANRGVVNGGAVFNGSAINDVHGIVNGGAVFNGTSRNKYSNVPGTGPRFGKVNGGATFNDAACSEWMVGGVSFPAFDNRIFIANIDFDTGIVEEPTCNGTAPKASGAGSSAPFNPSCGCG